MKSRTIHNIVNKRISVNFFPFNNMQVSFNFPIFVDSLCLICLLRINNVHNSYVFSEPHFFFVSRFINLIDLEAYPCILLSYKLISWYFNNIECSLFFNLNDIRLCNGHPFALLEHFHNIKQF